MRSRTDTARWAAAVLAPAVAVGLRLLLHPWLGDDAPMLLLAAAVAGAAWYGGLFPGLLATALSLVAGAYFFLLPDGLPVASFSDRFRLVLFALIGAGIAWMGEKSRMFARRAEERRHDSERAAATSAAEAAASEIARARLLATLAGIEDAVFALDEDGRILIANRAAAAFTIDGADPIGRPLREVLALRSESDGAPLDLPAPGAGPLAARIATSEDPARPVEIKVGRIGPAAGTVVVLHDLSTRRAAALRALEQARLLELRLAVASALSSTADVRRALQLCTDALVDRLDVAFARIWTLAPGEDVLRLQASSGLYTHLDGPHGEVPVGAFKIGRIAATRRPHLTNEVLTDPYVSDPEWARREGMQAFAGYPLLLGDRVVGVMGMFARAALSEAVIDDLAPLADGIAQFLDRVAKARSLERSEELHRALAELAADWGMVFRIVDGELIVDQVTGGFRAVTGHELAEFEGRDVLAALVVPADAARLERAVGAWRAGGTAGGEVDMRAADGRTLRIAFHGRAVAATEGRVASVYVAAKDVTEETRARTELARQREWFRTTLASIGDAVITTDTRGRVTLLNPVAEAMTGWSLADARGRPLEEVFRIVGEESGEPVENPAVRALAEGTVVGLANHTVLIARDGSEHAIDDSAAPIRNENGEVQGAVLVFRDVGERRRMEREQRDGVERLRESEARNAAIVRTSLDGIITIDGAGRVVEFNPAAERMFGYERAEVMGQEMAAYIIPRALRDAHRRGLRHHLETGEGPILGKRLELEALRADGSTFPVEVVIDRIGGEGDPLFTGYIRDVTEQRASETALRTSEERFRDLAEHISQFAWMTDAEGWIFWYNQRWYDYTGTDLEAMRGWGWRAVHHPDHVERVTEKFKRHIASGEAWEDTFPLRGADGAYRWFLSRARPIRDESGAILRWFGTNTDITEQLAMQEELREVAARLSEADRRKDEFLATLAHELRNPLAPIRTGLDVLRHARDDVRTFEVVRSTMERQTRQLISLVDDLLNVSRITRGKLELRRQVVPLSEVVTSAVESCRSFMDEREHELTIETPDDDVHLDVDPNRLAQVLANLLDNAAKYTPRGGHVLLRAEVEGADVRFTVRDDGVGIPSDMQERVFEMFAQVDRPMERGYTGLGIGLTLVRSLVEMHGGTVAVASEGEGLGTTFTVTLPVVRSAAAHVAPASDEEAPSSPDRRTLRVLIVDDNEAAARMLALVVERLGHEVRLAGDGAEALEVHAAFSPDVVLMDLGMPVMNGYEAARRLRADGETGLIVALTGWGQEEDRRRAREAGFDRHLVKPVGIAAIRELLDGAPRPARD